MAKTPASALTFSKELVDDSSKKKSESALARLLLQSPPRVRSGSMSSDTGNPNEAGDPSTTHTTNETVGHTTGDVGDIAPAPQVESAIPSIFTCTIFVTEKTNGTEDATRRRAIVCHFSEDCSPAALVACLLQQSNALTSAQKLDQREFGLVVSQLEICAADENGQIDEDFPPLDARQSIRQFGVTTFLIRGRESTGINAFVYAAGIPNELHLGARESKHDLNPRLLRAAERGDIDEFASLLKQPGVSIEAVGIDNFRSLHFAARKGHLPIINYILRHFPQVEIDAQTKNGWTPLHLACAQGHLDVAEFLLSYGADPNVRNNAKLTCLTLATQNSKKPNSELTDLLKEFGAVA